MKQSLFNSLMGTLLLTSLIVAPAGWADDSDMSDVTVLSRDTKPHPKDLEPRAAEDVSAPQVSVASVNKSHRESPAQFEKKIVRAQNQLSKKIGNLSSIKGSTCSEYLFARTTNRKAARKTIQATREFLSQYPDYFANPAEKDEMESVIANLDDILTRRETQGSTRIERMMEEFYCGEYKGPLYQFYIYSFNTLEYISKVASPLVLFKTLHEVGKIREEQKARKITKQNKETAAELRKRADELDPQSKTPSSP